MPDRRTLANLAVAVLMIAAFVAPVALPIPPWASWVLVACLFGIGIICGDILYDALHLGESDDE